MLLALPLLLTIPAGPTAQAGARYAAAVEAHAACDDAALAWVASLGEKALAAEASAGGVAAWPRTTVASAVVLHARIAASLWRAGAAGWRAHLEHARRLAARLDPRPAVHGWLAAWFSLAASQYLAAGDAHQAGELLDAVPRPLRREPLVLLARGALHEYLATDRLAPAERSQIDGASPLNSPSAVADDQRHHLERAARVYDELLAAHAEEVEAAVRLARVHLALGQPDRAAAALRRSPRDTSGPPSPLEYYAELVAGRVYEAHGQLAQAEAAYRNAATRFPAAQRPALALARLYVRGGAGGAARDEIERLLARSDGDTNAEDPWAVYYAGQYWRTATLLQNMMTGTLRCAR